MTSAEDKVAPADKVAYNVDPPRPPPPSDNRRATLRSATKSPPVASTFVAPAADITSPPPHAMQLSSPMLLSQPAPSDGNGFLLVAESRGHRMTPATRAVPPHMPVGVQVTMANAYEALSTVSSVISADPQKEKGEKGDKGDSLQTLPTTDRVEEIAPMAYPSLQALLENLYETFFGPDATSMAASTPLRFKELFDSGARAINRLMSDIQADHSQHQLRMEHWLHEIQAEHVTCHKPCYLVGYFSDYC
jgi:hypothetical protein